MARTRKVRNSGSLDGKCAKKLLKAFDLIGVWGKGFAENVQLVASLEKVRGKAQKTIRFYFYCKWARDLRKKDHYYPVHLHFHCLVLNY